MSSLEHITSKIIKDAEENKASILVKANEESDKIVSKKVEEANRVSEELLEKAKMEAGNRKDRILSNAELKVRNNKLGAKRKEISNVFDKTIEELCNLSDEDYKNFIKNTILSLPVDGDEHLIVNSRGKELVSLDLLHEINEGLKAQGKSGKITFSQTLGSFKGGFVLEKNKIEINSTFEALVDSLRDEMEFEVARVLFN